MSKVVVNNSLTLDGVMQAPGRADEDRRDGFAHGGWGRPYSDEVMGRAMAEGMADTEALVLGRRTYEGLAAYWPHQTDSNPFTDMLDNTRKYVASRSLTEPLDWQNSTLLDGDAADAVARLREQPGKSLVILGSGDLLQALMRRNLVDEYVLLIHPLLLGSGRRLFTEAGTVGTLRLVKSVTTTTGVVIATYQPTDRASR